MAYRTISGPGRGAFEVRGSEFVGRVRRAETVAEAEAFVEHVREEFADATHNVPAYRVRADPLREYQHDDGEPSSSAGKPALNVLQGQELENVVAVVTRYYGGTNLGVGGLVRAYGKAVKLAVEDAGVVTERPHERLVVGVDYDDSGRVRSILESAGVEFEADYEAAVTFRVWVPEDDAEDVVERVASATSGQADIERED